MTLQRKRTQQDHELAQQAAVRDQIALLERQKLALECRTDFLKFVKFTSPDNENPNDITRSRYKDAKHHRAICRVLEEVAKGNIKQLILTMPPRHGKSELTTRRFPAWVVGQFPHENVAVATYSDDFAADFGAEVRTIMQTPQYRQIFPIVGLSRGGTAKDRLTTAQGGLLFFVGRGGAMTGRGAHTLIVDDLIKDDKEASSQAVRDQAWNWFTKVAMTRRMGKKRVIVIMTRWHADDIVGRITDPDSPYFNAEEAAKWKIINLPALAEEDDALGRKVGEPLWPDGPDQFDLEFLESQKRLDPLGFSALYQQRPTAADGVLFERKNIGFYEPDQLPTDLRMYAASDHAVAVAQRRDYTVLLMGGVDRRGHLYLVDCIWRRMAADVTVESMLTMTSIHKPLLWWAGKDHITKSIGPFLRKRMLETQTFINLREVAAAGDKEQRAQSIAARVAMGAVWFPKNAPWTERAIDEMMAFPNGTHDDFVDALSLFGVGLPSQFGKGLPREPTKIPKYGTLGWVKFGDRLRQRDEAAALAGGY